MTRYHLNPDSGRVGLCKAEKRCPLVDAIHGETKEQARENFENTMMAREFPVLKKAEPFEPSPIDELSEVLVESGGRKHHRLGNTSEYSELVWFRHRGEVIGYAKLMRQKSAWKNDESTHMTLCDFQVREPGLGHGRKLLEKLQEEHGAIYVSGGATPEGAKFLLANRDLVRQEPALRRNPWEDLNDPQFRSTFDSMSFVTDWDNSRPKYPL